MYLYSRVCVALRRFLLSMPEHSASLSGIPHHGLCLSGTCPDGLLRLEGWSPKAVNELELSILSPLVTRLRRRLPYEWDSLKYQTQFGPYCSDFPYYPAALDFKKPAQEAVHSLSRQQKRLLVDSWRSHPRPVSLTSEQAILDRWALVLVDRLVQRARAAGARTSSW